MMETSFEHDIVRRKYTPKTSNFEHYPISLSILLESLDASYHKLSPRQDFPSTLF